MLAFLGALIVVGIASFFMDVDVPIWVVTVTALLGLAAFVIGTFVGTDIWGKIFSNPVDEGVRFWRSLGAIFSLVVGYVLAEVADRNMDHPNP